MDKRLPFLVFTIFGVFGIVFTSLGSRDGVVCCVLHLCVCLSAGEQGAPSGRDSAGHSEDGEGVQILHMEDVEEGEDCRPIVRWRVNSIHCSFGKL